MKIDKKYIIVALLLFAQVFPAQAAFVGPPEGGKKTTVSAGGNLVQTQVVFVDHRAGTVQAVAVTNTPVATSCATFSDNNTSLVQSTVDSKVLTRQANCFNLQVVSSPVVSLAVGPLHMSDPVEKNYSIALQPSRPNVGIRAARNNPAATGEAPMIPQIVFLAAGFVVFEKLSRLEKVKTSFSFPRKTSLEKLGMLRC